MTLWIALAAMSLVAVAFAVWPLYRAERKLSLSVLGTTVFVVALSAGLYNYQGRPELPSAASGDVPSMDDVVADLAARLDANPDDVNGWQMLGRSYMNLGNYAGAVEAFERAMALESGQNAQTLVSLGEALLASTGSAISGRVATLFENALAIDSNNPQALFYGGIGAFNRNDRDLAATRWERLLALNPPPEIQGVLQQRIAEWRGEMPAGHPQVPSDSEPATASPAPAAASPAPSAAPATSAPLERPGAVVSAAISVTPAAAASLPAEATVFVIARDPAQPVPPIAVTRRRLSELPLTVQLGDRESMVPGRSLSAFAEFELIARVSVSGGPAAKSGDWFGSEIVKPAESNRVELSIQEQVP